MIDEKRLLKELEEMKQIMLPSQDGKHPISIETVIDYIKYFEKVNEWIPVSERLPEDNKMSEYYDSVIVTLDSGRVVSGCYVNSYEEWWVDAEDGEKCSINATGRVVAWMPLPPAYRGEEHGADD